MSPIRDRLVRLAAGFVLLAAGLTLACSSEPEAPPAKVLHVLNPFRLQGLRPYVHSAAVANWAELGQMADEGGGASGSATVFRDRPVGFDSMAAAGMAPAGERTECTPSQWPA